MNLEQLLRAIRDREDGAFERFVRATRQPLYDYFVKRCEIPPEFAEDIMHDLWMTVHREVPGKQHPSLRAWLFRVARNMSTDYYRSIGRLRETSLSHVRLLIDANRGVSSQYRSLRQQRKLEELLSEMPLAMREVAQLDLDGGDAKEFAASRGLTDAAVRALRWRYRAYLRKRFPLAFQNSRK